jgi:hypothetical protein
MQSNFTKQLKERDIMNKSGNPIISENEFIIEIFFPLFLFFNYIYIYKF